MANSILPSKAGFRKPTSANPKNGNIINVRRYPDMGGLRGPGVLPKGGMPVVPPGKGRG